MVKIFWPINQQSYFMFLFILQFDLIVSTVLKFFALALMLRLSSAVNTAFRLAALALNLLKGIFERSFFFFDIESKIFLEFINNKMRSKIPFNKFRASAASLNAVFTAELSRSIRASAEKISAFFELFQKQSTVVFMSILFFSFNCFSMQTAKNFPKLIPKVIMHLTSVINDIPAKDAASPAYEKQQSSGIMQSAKVLYDAAREQMLNALSEIDNRITYWQHQKDHPWSYFVSKNPLKWVTGPAQEDEIENNLETLKSHQGELYVLLGNLAQLGSDFNAGYKNTFRVDYEQGYAWVDRLLDALVRIHTRKQAAHNSPFIARINQLQEKLENVGQFKDELLSDISETSIPPYLARNWLKGGAALLAMGYGYKSITYDHIIDSLGYLKTVTDPVTDPVREIVENLVTPASAGTISPYEIQSKFVKDFVREMGKKYKLATMAESVTSSLDTGDYSPYRAFVEEVGKRESLALSLRSPSKSIAEVGNWLENLKDYARGKLLGVELDIALARKQSAALWQVGLTIPAFLSAMAIYSGYQTLTQKDYSPLRRALVAINSLFVDPTKPFTDEQVGKMTYLIHMLKRRAEKELPTKNNISADFIHDLELLESSEFNVAAKRAMVDDMFKKYEFLGLIQKK